MQLYIIITGKDYNKKLANMHLGNDGTSSVGIYLITQVFKYT